MSGSRLRSSRPTTAELVERLRVTAKTLTAERDAAVAHIQSLRDWYDAWLIRARMAVYREGWEEGMSVSETADALTSVLSNLGLDEGSGRPADIADVKRLMAMPIEYAPPRRGGA